MASYRRKPEEAVTILLEWLKKTKQRVAGQINQSKPKSPKLEQFQDIEKKLEGLRDLLPKLKEWEESFMKELDALEKDINGEIEDGTQLEMISKKLQLIDENAKNFKNNIQPIELPRKSGAMTSQQEPLEAQPRKLSDDWIRLKVEEKILVSPAMASLHTSYDILDYHSKLCLLCFSIFPDNSVIKKRPLINWWIAEGFIKPQKKTADVAEKKITDAAEGSIKSEKIAGDEGSNTRSEKMSGDTEETIQHSHESSHYDMNTKIDKNSAGNKEDSITGTGKKNTDQVEKTGDQVGEEKFKELIRLGFIQPVYNTRRPAVNSCKMHPWIRRMLISIAKKSEFFDFDFTNTPVNNDSPFRRGCLVSGGRIPKGDDLLTLFNVNEQYLNLKADWFSKLKKLVVLQLGRWQTSAARHLEVENNEFLNHLGTQKQLKYLSLHGVSRITELPFLIELINLEILELRACHNLEKLPADFALLRKLTHLDLSECYLLEGMPKGLEKLASLQVLKGFLIGKPWSTDYKFASLSQLTKLWKLSICIGRDATVEELDLENLKDIINLRILSITWEKVASINEGEQSSTTSALMTVPKAPEALENKGDQSSSTAANLTTKKAPVVLDYKAEQSSKTPNPTMEKASEALENNGEQSIGPANSTTEVSKASEIQGDQSITTAKLTMEEESLASEEPAKLKKKEKLGLWRLPCRRAKEAAITPAASEKKKTKSELAITPAAPEKKNTKSEPAAPSMLANLKSKISFPPDLEKLDLWCLPCWPDKLKPTNLKNLKRLYIRGGTLDNFPKSAGEKWNVEILRLKYLKNLKFELNEMKEEFPMLIYLEKVKCKDQGKDKDHYEWTRADQEKSGSESGSESGSGSGSKV